MAKIRVVTALEIIGNPKDLDFVVSRDETSGKFSIGVFRGPGHCGKPLITSERPFADTLETGADSMRGILIGIYEVVQNYFENPHNELSGSLNHDGKPLSDRDVLNPELIEKIVNELKLSGTVSTYKEPFLSC
jgi:hypothetical protein